VVPRALARPSEGWAFLFQSIKEQDEEEPAMPKRSEIAPVVLDGDCVVIIDQRRLPGRLVRLRLDSCHAVAGAIQELAVRGAPAIGVAAAYAVVLAAADADRRGLQGDSWACAVQAAGEAVAAARPTAVNLGWAVARLLQVVAAGGRTAELRAEAVQLAAEDLLANHAIGRQGAALLGGVHTVLTHCNAGALATAGFGTALGVVRELYAGGGLRMVYATETRPLQQGLRLTAWELARDGIPVTVITDGAAAWFIGQGAIEAVIVGADRIARNGDVANKIGTYGLAVVAARHGVPFYVAAPVSTIDGATPDGSAIPVEERRPEEVTHSRGRLVAPHGVRAANPAFDVTPAELVTAIITEVGVLRAPYLASLGAVLDHAGGAHVGDCQATPAGERRPGSR